MNKTNFILTGGFPLELETLDFMQKSWQELQAMTAFGGDNVIVSGCNVVGANVSDGFVIIGGELLSFRGGLAQAKVVIKEETFPTEFQNGSFNNAYLTRYATFGNSLPNVLFADLVRLSDLKSLSALVSRVNKLETLTAPLNVANGSMLFWRKPANTIPAGWQEVIDWRGRMPVGFNPADVDFDTVGEAGGSKTHQNTLAEMVPHDHPYDDTQPNGGTDFGNGSTRFSYTQTQTVGKTTGKTGGVANSAQPYSIMNPYRIVMFIEPIPA
ncbi:MAG TPA: hypothetical protein VK541_17395 [Pedobacter sp.]|uniref:hypothetical protein n=1 Tax=Pedobacter sp. TaxID=1411316 RepID=UPI002CA4165D|nr:hypothetical protein [Pedobacter sp.]HMI04267.1 hypothetical protein [Pedobacter sp.]